MRPPISFATRPQTDSRERTFKISVVIRAPPSLSLYFCREAMCQPCDPLAFATRPQTDAREHKFNISAVIRAPPSLSLDLFH